MPYKRRGAQSSEASTRKYRKSDEEHNDEGSLRNIEGNNNYYIVILINVNTR